MFAREVSVRLKPNSLQQFTTLIACEILPWLRTQEGFLGLITLAASDASEMQAISFWHREANAQACNSGAYPGVLKNLAALMEGISYSKTFEVMSSTLERLSAFPPQTSVVEAGKEGESASRGTAGITSRVS